MKITSTLSFNTSLLARHTAKDKNNTKVIVGGALPDYINIPAGATLELEDSKWKKFEESAKSLVEAGHLVITQAPKLSKEDQEESDKKELEAASAIVARLTKAVPAIAGLTPKAS